MTDPVLDRPAIESPSLLTISGSTLIVGDLHLSSLHAEDDIHVTSWLQQLLRENAPSTLVFAGDTFELSFRCPGAMAGGRPALEDLLCVHRDLMWILSKQHSLQHVIFLRGDHDHVLGPAMLPALAAAMPRATVSLADAVLETRSRSYITHGNQLDYNITTVQVNGETLTDRLTQLFEKYLFSTSGAQNELIADVMRGNFSFWYATGRLPRYLDLTKKLFYYQPSAYIQALWDLFRSDFFAIWTQELPRGLNRAVAVVVRFLSRLPSWSVWWTSPIWFHLCSRVFRRRALQILKGSEKQSLMRGAAGGPLHNVVLSHAHEAASFSIRHLGQTKRAYIVTTPRWHVSTLRYGQLELSREASAVLIRRDGVLLHLFTAETKLLPRRSQ